MAPEESTAVLLLREILGQLQSNGSTLQLILATIQTRTVKRKSNARSRLAKLAAEAQETLADQEIPKEVLRLWSTICPDCRQPVGMDADRRNRCRAFWSKMGGEEGVASVFTTVAGNDWLCGRPVDRRGAKRPAGPVGLWDVMTNVLLIVEGSYR